MVTVFRSGKNTNKVISVLDKLIVKKYLSYDRKRRDLKGIEYWKKVNKDFVPKGYITIGKIVVLQYSGSPIDIKISNELKNSFYKQLAQIFGFIFRNYSKSESSQRKFHIQWIEYVSKIRNFDVLYRDFLKTKLTYNTYLYYENQLDELIEHDWAKYIKLPIHRDLTTDNIVFSYKGKLKIIDFEHFCIGPLEYEFCNSVFWNDEYSINFDAFTEILKEENIVIDKELTYRLTVFYFLDQINLAYISKDIEKINLLIDKFEYFVNQYTNILSISPNILKTVASPIPLIQIETMA